MDISVYTNHSPSRWHPNDLANFLGGNEETLVLWSKEMAKHSNVTIYTSLPDDIQDFDDGDVLYLPRNKFDFNAKHDVLISFKDGTPWMKSVDANIKIHWSNDVEPEWPILLSSQIDKFVTLGIYHESRMPWLPKDRSVIIPLGLDIDYFQDDGREKHDLLIYTSSPDRGLNTILEDWSRIWPKLGDKWRFIATYSAQSNPQLAPLFNQPGVAGTSLNQQGMADLYRNAKIWGHPLNNPDSDLAGVGANKAHVAGCKLVVNQIETSGFRDTIEKYIPYWEFLKGNLDEVVNPNCNQRPRKWGDIVENEWLPLIATLLEAKK